MNFEKLAALAVKPPLDTPGTAVMWTNPYISRKLLEFHLNPEVDAASRKPESIIRTVDWILSSASSVPINILDLGCGPGLYAERLAAAGHRVTGVDFSANSIAYARSETEKRGSGITYLHKSYLEPLFENAFDLAMIIYTDFCVLCPPDRERFLKNVCRALRPGGLFLFDVTNTRNLEAKVMPESWELCPRNGFWREGPYLSLSRGYLYPEVRTLLEQRIVTEPDGRTESYHFWHRCYEPGDLEPVLAAAGLEIREVRSDILPGENFWTGENISFYSAEKR
jgi:SAM-dependent methyltransferase